MGGASITEHSLDHDVRAVTLSSETLEATVLIDKGADIYRLVYPPKGLDVLWKSPWGLRRPGGRLAPVSSSEVGWIESYEGGWQVIFPNGGDPCVYKGVELNFHGEASMLAWDYEVAAGPDAVELRLSVRLARGPFRIERTMRLDGSRPVLSLKERITNEGGEAIDYMWGHHPAYGAPFLSAACRIDTNARTLIADDTYDPPHNPLDPGRRYTWPRGEWGHDHVDLAAVPGPDAARAALGYFADYEGDHAWYGITNRELGVGVGMVWPVSDFPYAWFWQEMHASPNFPWYKSVYVMAIEPGTSYPGQGLVNVMAKSRTHRTLEPGESAEAELRAVFFESRIGIVGIDSDGKVTTAEDGR